MYTPRDKFEAVRYGQMYGANPNATKRDMRRNGRQFRRYLRTDVADRDRAAYEAYEQQRRAAAMADNEAALTSQLYGSMDRSMKIDTSGALERMNANFDTVDQRRAELAEQDLTNRIANANRFSDAFRTARQAGLKEFTWKGKRYGTQLASEVPSAPAPVNQPAQKPEPEQKPKPEQKPAQKPAKARFNLSDFASQHGLKVLDYGGGYGPMVRYDPDGRGDFLVDANGNIYHAGMLGLVGDKARSGDYSAGSTPRKSYDRLRGWVNAYDLSNPESVGGPSSGMSGVMINTAMATDPAIMQSAGWSVRGDGSYDQRYIDDASTGQLRDNLAIIGATGSLASGAALGAATRPVTPLLTSAPRALPPANSQLLLPEYIGEYVPFTEIFKRGGHLNRINYFQ